MSKLVRAPEYDALGWEMYKYVPDEVRIFPEQLSKEQYRKLNQEIAQLKEKVDRLKKRIRKLKAKLYDQGHNLVDNPSVQVSMSGYPEQEQHE